MKRKAYDYGHRAFTVAPPAGAWVEMWVKISLPAGDACPEHFDSAQDRLVEGGAEGEGFVSFRAFFV